MSAGFPQDDYTPHGYLQNRYDAGGLAGFDAGGPIRSVAPIGFEWHLRRPKMAAARGGLLLGFVFGDDWLLTESDFSARDVVIFSRYHTSRAQSFDFTWRGIAVEATFFLADRDALGCRIRIHGSPGTPVRLIAVARTSRLPGANAAGRSVAGGAAISTDPGPWFAAVGSSAPNGVGFGATPNTVEWSADPGVASRSFDPYLATDTVCAAVSFSARTNASLTEIWLALGRGSTANSAADVAKRALESSASALPALLDEDSVFWSRAPRLAGGWPDEWRRGWVYDAETTRLLVFPPAGVFAGPWPSWMVEHPRVVLAENCLDMLRFGLAAPDLAWTALETVFETAARDGTPQVPCLLANGLPDMVAESGSPCGTSPAWCLPLHCLRLLYLLAPRRESLARLYPHLAAYVEWWLANRTDRDGWLSYRCTWEAGEDASPRIDPDRTGHRDVAGLVRPVELQAALAVCARALAFFAGELGRPSEEIERWSGLFAEYAERTRRMWDPDTVWFRDLDPSGRFTQVDTEYWGTTVDRDALQLIPLLDGIATCEQLRTLAASLDKFDAPPWTLWPSWSFVVAEAALAAGRPDMAARMSFSILDRVYPENDRRTTDGGGPLPGAAREYWPLDLSRWDGHEAYGWGANTALHLLRYLIGFAPSDDTSSWAFELRPMLDLALTRAGRPLELVNLWYRGHRVDLSFARTGCDRLTVTVRSEAAPERWKVSNESGIVATGGIEEGGAGVTFAATPGQVCRVEASWPGESADSVGRAIGRAE